MKVGTGGEKIDNFAVLTKGDNLGGQTYIHGKHCDGNILIRKQAGPNAGAVKTTSYFPTGKTIQGSGIDTKTLPSRMTTAQSDELIELCLEKRPIRTDIKGTTVTKTYSIDKYGVKEMVIEFDSNNMGPVKSAYPTKGESVYKWVSFDTPENGKIGKWMQWTEGDIWVEV